MIVTEPEWLVSLQTMAADELSEEITRQVATKPGRALHIRNLLGVPSRQSGDLSTAWTVCESLVASEPQNPVFLLDKASLALRLGKPADALDAARLVLAVEPTDGGHQARALQVMLQADAVEEAARNATLLRRFWQGNPRLAYMSLLALSRNGSHGDAADAALSAIAGEPGNLDIAGAAADALMHDGRAPEALDVLQTAGAETSGDGRAWFELARARARVGLDEKAVDAARRSLALAPGNLRAIDLLARLLARIGQRSEAEALLAAIPEAKRTTAVRSLQVDLKAARGAFAEAAPLARKLLSEEPENLPLVRQMVGVLARAGAGSEASEIYQGVLARRRQGLPDSFASAAKDLMGGADYRDPLLPGNRLEWLHGRLASVGHEPADRAAWQDSVRRGLALDLLILDWIETRGDRIGEVTAMIDIDQSVADRLRTAQRAGHGVILAAAHVGLMFAGLAAVHGTGLPSTFVASTPKLEQGVEGADLLSTSTGSETAIARGLLEALRRGRIVSIAIDGASVDGNNSLMLFDRRIAVSDAVPRIAWRTGCASFFPLVVPTLHGRMRATVSRLPDPGDFPTIKSYSAAWFHAFSGCLHESLIAYPEAARASGGFWRNASV